VNQVANGGFGDGTLSPWIFAGVGTYSFVAGHNSNTGLSLTTSGLGGLVPVSTAVTLEQTIVTVPGTMYRFSVYVNNKRGNSGSTFSCRVGNLALNSFTVPTNININQWVLRTFDFTALLPVTVVSCVLTSSVSAEVVIDDVSFERPC